MDDAGARSGGAQRGRPFTGFQELMPYRVQDILLVSSLYDSFILQEEGRLGELILGEFLDFDLHHTPDLTHVSSGAEALELLRRESRFNLIVTALYPGDMDAAQLAREARTIRPEVPVVVLAYDYRELKTYVARNPRTEIERVFLWQGNPRILLAIVKFVEDRRNVAHDTRAAGVQALLVVEDNIRYYSAFLPVIYTELITQSQRLVGEGLNPSHRMLRMRARPKILHCTTFEEAWQEFTEHRDYLLGVISDVEFPHQGQLTPDAGFELARLIREQQPDVPILLQSSRPQFEARARGLGFSFLRKRSPTLLADLRRFMVEQFAFGDFVFRLPDGVEVDRASDLKTLEEKLHTVPAESIAYHGERNHFSTWLIARTEFALAHRLRPRRVSEFPSLEHLRRDLIGSIAEYRREQGEALVNDFDRAGFDASSHFFSRIGGGSLGGKARGLAFVRRLLQQHDVRHRFPRVRVEVPSAIVLATGVFDRFLAENDLLDFAINTDDDASILRRFLEAPFPAGVVQDLQTFLADVDYPLAVRSSSLLEDSQYQPFTGVYETFMLPNNHPEPAERLAQLVGAVKRVFASTFSQHAKGYLRATPYRLEEEKMAVVIQRVVGATHGTRFYPDFAGVARSHNFYPAAPVTPADGIAAVALGLGKSVVDGGKCLTFCPRYPRHMVQFSSVEDILANSQRDFWALDLDRLDRPRDPEQALRESPFGLEAAEADGTLALLASTYSHENHAVYDGLSRPGVRLVSFAPILKHQAFPLPEILNLLLDTGRAGLGRAVEIEFAVRLARTPQERAEFGFLQLRPLVLSRELEELDVTEDDPSRLVCSSAKVLGNGRIENLCDVVAVDFHRFERAQSQDVARQVERFNAELVQLGVPYLLIGVGRWGSNDPWLGIPVEWDQISGARVIVETGFKDFRVTPSQGSHFFQNLTAFQVGYFTVNPEAGEGFVDWDWLAAQPALQERGVVRHLRFARPLLVKMNGRRNQGVIYKPASGAAP
jgi:CheY-like chemotaxis protein